MSVDALDTLLQNQSAIGTVHLPPLMVAGGE
jgi:hypothetical protein